MSLEFSPTSNPHYNKTGEQFPQYDDSEFESDDMEPTPEDKDILLKAIGEWALISMTDEERSGMIRDVLGRLPYGDSNESSDSLTHNPQLDRITRLIDKFLSRSKRSEGEESPVKAEFEELKPKLFPDENSKFKAESHYDDGDTGRGRVTVIDPHDNDFNTFKGIRP